MNTLYQWLEGKKIRNKPKGYDGDALGEASDYYGIAAENWSEIIRYEDGHDSAISSLQIDLPTLLSTMEAEIRDLVEKKRMKSTELTELQKAKIDFKRPVPDIEMAVYVRNNLVDDIHEIIHEYLKTQI